MAAISVAAAVALKAFEVLDPPWEPWAIVAIVCGAVWLLLEASL